MQHRVPIRTYLYTFIALMALLILTVGLSFIDLGATINDSLAMTIAAIKGLLILFIFMHIWYSPRLHLVFAAAGFIWLGIMIVLTMSEYLARHHPPGVNPRGEPVYLNASK